MKKLALFLAVCLVSAACAMADTVTRKKDAGGRDVVDAQGDPVFVVEADPETVTKIVAEGSRATLAFEAARLEIQERLLPIQREMAVLEDDQDLVDAIDAELPRVTARKVRLENAVAVIDALP